MKSEALTVLQHALQLHLLNGDEAIGTQIQRGGIGVARRLAIYRDGYRLRLLAALRDTFAHTALWVGDEAFDALALRYVEAHPSTLASLNDYGANWPEWLASAPEAGAIVADLAALDWALRRAFDGADSPVLQRAALTEVAPQDWASVGFVLVPTFRALAMHGNAVAIWAALDSGEAPPAAEPNEDSRPVIVWRRGHQPTFRSLAPTELQALRHLHDGGSFAALCERLSQHGEGEVAVQTAGQWLQRWIHEELLAALTTAPT
jgi:hypothetical protein